MHMKCPVCGNQLESGYVSAAQVVFFTTKEPKNPWWIAPREGDITLTSQNWTLPVCEALHCPNCKMVMIYHR